MKIRQIQPNVIDNKKHWYKWYCSDHQVGSDQHPVIRYLQEDGTWGQATHYFNTKAELQKALDIGIKPDFSMSTREIQDRAMLREDMKRTMDRLLDDDEDLNYE